MQYRNICGIVAVDTGRSLGMKETKPNISVSAEELLKCRNMSNTEALAEIVSYELWAEENLASGKISQEEAWDIFFCLLHECDERELIEDRERILTKIDTKKYNPFESAHGGVRFLAVLRARMLSSQKETSH